MDVTGYISKFASQVASTPPSAVPGIIISSYSELLWNYEPDSWVAKIAYSARVVAILVSLPIVILGLLDISSYGIARTLRIVDDVKASTSDKAVMPVADAVPPIHIRDEGTPTSESTYTDSDRESPVDQATLRGQRRVESKLLAVSLPEVFYASGDNSLKLAGADVFSPAASQPPSPVTTRKSTYFEQTAVEDEDKNKFGAGLRNRLTQIGEKTRN